MPDKVRKLPRVLLCVVPYPANTGFAWNYIEGLYGGISDLLAADGVTTYVAYQVLDAPPEPLAGSTAQAIALDASLRSWGSVLKTIAHIWRLDVDTVYFTDICMSHWALPLLRLAGVHWIVAHDHTSGHRDQPRGLKRIAKRLRSRVPGMLADRILTVSEYVARRQRDVALVPPARVFTVLNGVSLPDLGSQSEALALADVGAERPVVTCVCRAAPEKGVDVLFKAFELVLREWPTERSRPVLVYVGDGPALPALVALRDSLAVAGDIHIMGYRTDVATFLRSAALCVVPSLWEDACPLGVLEPMAWGKPVIASAVGGVPEEINSPQVGVLVPKGDEQALADAIRTLLLDQPKAEAIGLAARARIKRDLNRDVHLRAIITHLMRAT